MRAGVVDLAAYRARRERRVFACTGADVYGVILRQAQECEAVMREAMDREAWRILNDGWPVHDDVPLTVA